MPMAAEVRERLIDFLRNDLVGPAHGENEILEEPPKLRYLAGVLFPQGSMRNDSISVSGVDDDADGVVQNDPTAFSHTSEGSSDQQPSATQGARATESDHDDVVTLANSYRPSAVGLTFVVDGADSLVVRARAAVYDNSRTVSADNKRQYPIWTRRPLEINPVSVSLKFGQGDQVVSDGLSLRSLSRPHGDGRFLVTLSLYNTTLEGSRSGRAFFQTGFSVETPQGLAKFVEYHPASEELPRDDETVELVMLFRHRAVFAVGHGCAADWAGSQFGTTALLWTQDIPAVTVPPVLPLEGNESYLNMEFLSERAASSTDAVPSALEELCKRYEEWIAGREQEAKDLNSNFQVVAARNIALCIVALKRMRAGIALLRDDPAVLEAFILANRAMLMQQAHSKLRRQLGSRDAGPWAAPSYRADWNSKRGFWRAFQIAFILMAIPGVASPESEVSLPGETVKARDLVDLIWFPTGGGKTEAYLGLAAFVVFLERLRHGEGVGCKVLMRYTLRLLTSQQFQRAASLICACEVIRRADETKFGNTPISIGLWVGESLTPNTEKDALTKLAILDRKKGDAKNPFQLLACPWCGTELDNPARLGYAEHRGRLVFVCPDRHCSFGRLGQHLPVCIVDESLYRYPATLIIGTVDKFAMLAWREQASTLLKAGGGPTLIIQDELHLISGPLGSMVGLYEAAIDYLCAQNGRKPKIIASTATIRRAEVQCRALYDRPMFQFPPSGIDASNSFFAREEPSSPGRVYVGFLPTAASSPLTAQIRSVVALLQGAILVPGSDATPDVIDPYWTLVQYFGSLKELGRAATFITADIPEFLPTMHRRYAVEGPLRRFLNTSEELTSRKNEEEIPKILKRLEIRYEPSGRWETQALDTLLATNMISVGVDVDRLGLMMIVTQPKGTSEYIQASSRVGRSPLAPGLVLTLYNAGRPRDRSHYEHFRAYHEAFYRFVEPTSVTPFSPPALERALHAVLTIAGRHIAGWEKPTDFDPQDAAFADFLDFLRARVRRVDAEHLAEFDSLLAARLDDWDNRRPTRWGDLGGASDERVLLWPAGLPIPAEFQDSWATPTSMRNVDVECGAEVIARYPSVGPK